MADELTLDKLYTFDKATGTISPADYADVEDVVKNDICEALGIEGEVELATPMGRMLEWLSLYFTRVLGLNVQNSYQMLVSAAAGQQLDAIAQWFQLARRTSSYSTVVVTCSGVAGTVIPADSTVRSTNGDVFEALAGGTIGASGAVDITFEAVEKGAIPVVKDTVNILDTAISGWESCNNSNNGVVGTELETDESLRERIVESRTVAPGFIGAIKNAVEKVVGRGSSMVIENNTGANLPVHRVDMEPHSILVCVDGLVSPSESSDNDTVKAVAQAIFDNKPCGTGYTKARSISAYGADETSRDNYQYVVPVKDPYGNEYTVYFCAPIPQPVTVAIQVQKRTYTGVDVSDDVTQAINAWEQEMNFKCGESIYASDIMKAVEERVPGIVVISCTVSDAGSDKGTAFLEIDAIHKAQITQIIPSLYTR